ncbi:MAG TPA: YbaB/EbfC family nucleoid-associated protein [Candidatus Bipolaricaulota bacterium]|nr:YbaB/EbfC family nucleoid-associated protein [Candidatus Bipolaricaulota bacterium]
MSFFDQIKQMKQLQAQMAEEFAEGSAGFGKVKIKINGAQEILDVQIDESLLENKEKLQNLIKEATNDAIKKIQRQMALKMRGQMGGGFPGL